MDDVSKDIKDFHKLNPNRKLAILGIFLFVFVSAILIGVYLSKGKTSLPSLQEGTTQQTQEADKTTLSMTSSATEVAVGDTVTVTVALAQTPVQAVDLVVNFDPTMFKASNVVNGTVYDDILRSEVKDGQVVVSATVSPSDPTNLKTGDVFTFTLQALKAGKGVLEFDPKLTITAKNGVNTLGTAGGATITVAR
ncbi:hypothetical protein A3H80_01550 [Candidatus Roizmanbacteria bacterium RIFCSPLOWO2_02_FULL_37_19]|uniref:Cohesin domain-containing protein n=1 Tax=Candidatus Roizmanbacteria bacterium RIFCSPHIGHO2_02_FULL_37_24 TaxID=1802037 RepID=A0A1F7H0Z9_9BACT|nr:MAG: hypothetical protein A2862_03400 [Candidatus Roizmanbacteria bacterium RIFCSPHIGHO2_01_FULL_38_41]OGK24604.1 MAG: hypothetical protein A3C24_02330 [Candidatus Roizmanbacteria bacterium RIFCSPHIGHO2_02_FULL_37_24]OGK32242.1 MAG: hypothetical protein A3E10_02270 [Candidatus Roizmanbacteria bacterium RIFCSPHIGHO2_12_FULL_37_23]OGK44835.1 MAG: hypothetical protein A2956_04340 [Candidatus Roizmanbacteria bacterium RIFCSPLOWO2_01_FULL_37_57]OGK53875.1 MAG: hypothetical protein A3H80_01550 [Ca